MTKHSGPYCGGKLHQRDGTCTQPPGWGTDHVGHGRCKLHGGCAPNARKSAHEAALTEQAALELAKLDVPPCSDPLTELSRLAGQVIAWKDAMAGKVNELTSLHYSTDNGEHLRAEIALWERALDRCFSVLAGMARLNVDERLTKISEWQGALIAEVIRGTLQELGVPYNDANKIIARRLRAVSAEGASVVQSGQQVTHSADR